MNTMSAPPPSPALELPVTVVLLLNPPNPIRIIASSVEGEGGTITPVAFGNPPANDVAGQFHKRSPKSQFSVLTPQSNHQTDHFTRYTPKLLLLNVVMIIYHRYCLPRVLKRVPVEPKSGETRPQSAGKTR